MLVMKMEMCIRLGYFFYLKKYFRKDKEKEKRETKTGKEIWVLNERGETEKSFQGEKQMNSEMNS